MVPEIDPAVTSQPVVAYDRPSAGTIELYHPLGFDQLVKNEILDLVIPAVLIHDPDKHIPLLEAIPGSSWGMAALPGRSLQIM